jgi:hypothetical protein
MGCWGFLSGKQPATDPALAALAGVIEQNLRALGLLVQARPYGTGFAEIRASTSARLTTTPGVADASGVALLLAGKYDPPTVVFEEINSLRPGLGGQMVGAVIAALEAHPGVFERLRVNDLSPRLNDGRRWWEHIASSHPEFDWNITHDEHLTHFKTVS